MNVGFLCKIFFSDQEADLGKDGILRVRAPRNYEKKRRWKKKLGREKKRK